MTVLRLRVRVKSCLVPDWTGSCVIGFISLAVEGDLAVDVEVSTMTVPKNPGSCLC